MDHSLEQPDRKKQTADVPRWVSAPTPAVYALIASSILLVWLLTELLSRELMAGESVSGWYPTAGIGIAVLWAFGLRYLWAVGLAAGLGMIAIWGYEIQQSLLVCLVKVVCYGSAALVLRRILPVPVVLSKPVQVAGLLMAMIGCAGLTAFLSVGTLILSGDWSGTFWGGVLGWMIGDAIGIMVVTPLLVMVLAPMVCAKYCHPEAQARSFGQWWLVSWQPALITFLTTFGIVSLYVFSGKSPDFRVFYLGFIALPTLAMAYGLAGGLSGLLVLNTTGMIAVAMLGQQGRALEDLQLVMIALAICTIVVGSFSTMRRTAAEAAESGQRWATLAFRGSGLGRWQWEVGSEAYVTDHVLTDALGYTASEVEDTASWWQQRMHPEDLPIVEHAMRRHLEGYTEYFDAELRVRNRDDQWVWIYSQGKLTEWDDRDRPRLVVGTHSDITERKMLRQLKDDSESWHRSEKRFRALADAAPVGVFQTDDRGAFLYMNPAWSEISGFGLADALYRHASSFAYPDDRERVSVAWATAIASKTALNCEHRVKTPDGEVRWLATYARPMPTIDGRHGGFVGTAVDVTEYHDQVMLIRDSEARYRTLADQAYDMLWRVTPDAIFTYLSPSCEPLLGYTPEQMVGTDAYDYFHPDDAETVRTKHNRLTPESPQFKDLHRYRRSDGSYIWFEAVGQLVIPEHDPDSAYIVGISRDVTARIEAERVQAELETRLRRSQKLDAIGTFAIGIAHDFRNTLLAITASVQSARIKLEPDHPSERSLGLIEDASRQSMEITQSLLTFARGQGRTKEPADMSKLVRETVRLLTAMLPGHIQLQTQLPESGPWVNCNQSELQQVMMNLATNARDAMGKEGGVIDIRLSEESQKATLVFEDHGKGMDEETIRRAFEPFFTTKARLKGTGLGLALVHGIVTAHDGEIAIKSSPKRGTVVTLTLPALDITPPDQNPVAATQKEHAS